MAISLDTFKNPEFRGSFSKLPTCLLMAKKDYLFVKLDDAKLAGWTRREEMEGFLSQVKNLAKGKKFDLPKDYDIHCGEPVFHTFGDGKQEPGIGFRSPRIHVLAASPRLIEVTKKGADAGIGRKGDIIGNFETWQGKAQRESQPKEYTTLRTLYMLHLADSKGELLHKVPLVLSVHGGAAAYFGEYLEKFYKLMEVAFSDYYGDSFYTLDERARAAVAFEPVFEPVLVGDDQKSEICGVVAFKEPNALNVQEFFNFTHAERMWGTQKSLGGFAERYLKQFEEYHALAPGVQVNAVNVVDEHSSFKPGVVEKTYDVTLPISGFDDDPINF